MCRLFLLFLFISANLFAEKNLKYYEWKEVRLNFNNFQTIIGGKSIHDFWFSSTNNDLYHFKNDRIVGYKIFSKGKNRSVRYYYLKEKVYALIVGVDWKTRIYSISPSMQFDYGVVSDSPLYLAEDLGKGVLVAGDFGRMFLLSKTNYSEIKTNIKGHIAALLKRKDNSIIFGVIDGSSFSMDNFKIKELTKTGSNQNWFIGFYEDLNRTVYAKSNKDDLFVLKGSTFVKTNEDIFFPGYKTGTHNFIVTVFNNATNKEQGIELSSFPSILSFIVFENGGYCLSTITGKIFNASQEIHPLFIDKSLQFGLLPEIPNPLILRNNLFNGISSPDQKRFLNCFAIYDINKDGWLDCVMPGGEIPDEPVVYLSNGETGFEQKKEFASLDERLNGTFFWSADLNNDAQPDFIFNTWQDSVYKYFAANLENGKYKIHELFSLPVKAVYGFQQALTLNDFDADGLLDILLTIRYGEGGGKGKVLCYRNKGDFHFEKIATDWEPLTSGWNQQTICADLNNDGLSDIFISQNYSNDLILLNEGKTIKYKSLMYNEAERNQRKSKAVCIDYDNDGDLDIITLINQKKIKLFQNDGKANFTVIDSAFYDVNNKFDGNITNFCTGDFNNDGFIDLFISAIVSSEMQNYILFNEGGIKFKLADPHHGEIISTLVDFAASDIDNDGDLDLLGFSSSRHFVLQNTTNDSNFIKIHLRGMASNTNAVGCKIWLYAGEGSNKKLIGYKQIGSDNFSYSSQVSAPVHFGVKAGTKVDVEILFPPGNRRVIKNITAPMILDVNEFEGMKGTLFNYYQNLSNFFNNSLVQKSFMFFILSIMLTFSVMLFGERYLNWRRSAQISIFSISLIIYWLAANYFSLEDNYFNSSSPLLINIAFLALPLLYSMWFNTNFTRKSVTEKNEELLTLVLNFAHGQWAASNLISLKTLASNFNVLNEDKEYLSTLEERKATYLETVKPIITEIKEKLNLLPGKSINKPVFEKNFTEVNTLLTLQNPDYETLSLYIENLRIHLGTIRELQLQKFSVDPVAITKKIKNEYDAILKKENIDFRLYSEIDQTSKVVLKAEELAFVMDNCISNSIKALKTKEDDKKIIITVKEVSPKIVIEIMDNGIGVQEKEKLFREGYSKLGGTGLGLFSSLKKISRYHGNMYLKESTPFDSTIFAIELLKGF